jgi:hypothetical protein
LLPSDGGLHRIGRVSRLLIVSLIVSLVCLRRQRGKRLSRLLPVSLGTLLSTLERLLL